MLRHILFLLAIQSVLSQQPSSADAFLESLLRSDQPSISEEQLKQLLLENINPSITPDTLRTSGPPSDLDFESIIAEIIGTPSIPENLPRNQNCRCVSIFECNDDSNNDANGIHSTKIGTIVDLKTQGKVCPDPLQVCCRTPGSRKSTPSTRVPNCGTRSTLGQDVLIINTEHKQSQLGEFPWTVAIIRYTMSGGGLDMQFVCGGSLINSRVVLTVAHCVDQGLNNDNLYIRVGEWNFASESEPFPHEDIKIFRIIIHPEFNRDTLRYNIAMIVLEREVPLQKNINFICLPSPTDQWDSQSCISSGWGKKSFGKNEKYSRVMKRVNPLPLVKKDACEREFRKVARLGPSFVLDDTSICAGGNGIDTCEGDGGSPLICMKTDGSSQYVQVGIVAWGIGCNVMNQPGVYTSVTTAMPWIRQQLDNV